MKKLIHYSFLLFLAVLLVGCTQEKKGHLTRVNVQKINPDGNNGDLVWITDSPSIELFRASFEKTNWEPNIKPKRDRIEDVRATLFFEFDENMPERLFEYKIWFNKNNWTATIISDNEKEGYGELDKQNTRILKSEILNKTSDWEVRYDYMEEGKVLFSINPDPALSIAKPYGYMFNFAEPFGTYKGKKLEIYAYHKDMGERIETLYATLITEPSPGYSSLNRFTTSFELPLSGLWRIEVVLDEQIYGDVIISVKE